MCYLKNLINFTQDWQPNQPWRDWKRSTKIKSKSFFKPLKHFLLVCKTKTVFLWLYIFICNNMRLNFESLLSNILDERFIPKAYWRIMIWETVCTTKNKLKSLPLKMKICIAVSELFSNPHHGFILSILVLIWMLYTLLLQKSIPTLYKEENFFWKIWNGS